MYRFFKLSLNKTFVILFGFEMILIVCLGLVILALYQNQLNLAKSRDTHFNSYLLADELRQSSDDLTRFARAYVATGDPKFEQLYWTVLDVRNGKLPRPTDYNRIYWDFVATTGKKPRLDGATVSLHDLMIKEGFTQEEFDKLALAQKNSDDLVMAETVAMNAMKGLFDDGMGNFTIRKDPDPVLANRLMNDENYYKIKAEIMKPIDDFYVMFENRTKGEVFKYLQYSNILFWLVIILVLFILISFIYSFITIRKQIVEKVLAEKELSEINKNLEKIVKGRTKVLEKSEAKLKEALNESERLNKLMIGRELKMIELKDQLKNKR